MPYSKFYSLYSLVEPLSLSSLAPYSNSTASALVDSLSSISLSSVLHPLLHFSLPRLWAHVVFAAVTNFLCIHSVFVLQTECSPLTVTLLVTLRKFLSLLFSIYYFSNPFTATHAAGTALVFGGALVRSCCVMCACCVDLCFAPHSILMRCYTVY